MKDLLTTAIAALWLLTGLYVGSREHEADSRKCEQAPMPWGCIMAIGLLAWPVMVTAHVVNRLMISLFRR